MIRLIRRVVRWASGGGTPRQRRPGVVVRKASEASGWQEPVCIGGGLSSACLTFGLWAHVGCLDTEGVARRLQISGALFLSAIAWLC